MTIIIPRRACVEASLARAFGRGCGAFRAARLSSVFKSSFGRAWDGVIGLDRGLLRAWLVVVTLATTLFALPLVARGAESGPFISVGLGGGGAMFAPACSPHDHQLMFVACDMGGVYRTTDGGKSWNMLDKRQLRGAMEVPIQFHPADPKTLYAVSRDQFVVSHDRGKSFAPVVKDPPWKSDSITAVGVNPKAASQLVVGAGTAIYLSDDAGNTWIKSDGSSGRVLRFFVAGHASAKVHTLFAGTTSGVFRSGDNGRTWREASTGLPWRELQGFCGGRDEVTGRTALYCTIRSKVIDGKLAGGVFRSLDLGDSWQSAMQRGLNLDIGKQDSYGVEGIPQYESIAMAETRPNVVYVTTPGTGSRPPHHFTVYRSDDGGDSWRSSFSPGLNIETGWVPVDLNWLFGGPALNFNVCSSNPDVAMFTNHAELYITHDGGKSWQNAYSRRVEAGNDVKRGEAWASRGLEVTGCWQFACDPHEKQRAYICYTDIGFARSEDRGETWRHSAQGSPWRNTWYQIAFDHARAGVIYAACANHHGIPHYLELDPARQLQKNRRGGGVCLSEDFGASWRPLGKGLPEGAATSIVLDPKSDDKRRTLYVAMFGHGIYKSTDSGATWHNASGGLGVADNWHVYSVKLHADGTLFCSVTGKRTGNEFADGSGLFRSRDGGEHWQQISPPLKWAGGFDFDPRDSGTLYLTASTAPRHPQGGLYKTRDGGASWQQVVKEGDLPAELHGFIHAFCVAVHPKNPSTVYLCAYSHGLFRSEDAGLTWREIHGIPFVGVQQVAFDPLDENTVWVTTEGGGVWKGPAGGSEQ